MFLTLRAVFLTVCACACGASFAGAPALVRNINTMPVGTGSDPVFLGSFGNFTYFAATDGAHGRELWKTDGTAANTVLVRDINPGQGSSNPARFAVAGNLAYFSASTPTSGMELWVTDGTTSGTSLLTEFAPGNQPSDPFVAGALGNTALVVASNTGGYQLHRTDGTATGTTQLAEFGAASFTARSQLVVASNGKIYFSGFHPMHGSEPWVSDGTVAGTHRLEDGAPGLPITGTHAFVQAGNFVYFMGMIDNVGTQLWRIRVSDDEVEKVTTNLTIDFGFIGERLPLTVLGNLVIFVAGPPGSTTLQVWRSDGTPGGTFALGGFDYRIGNSQVNPKFTAIGNRVIYATNANGAGLEFLSTDGTSVQPVRAQAGFSGGILEKVGPWLYFFESGGAIGRTDGTPAGTTLLPPIPDFSPHFINQWIGLAGDAGGVYFGLHGADSLTGFGGSTISRFDPAASSWTVLRRAPSSQPPAEVFGVTNGRLFFSPSLSITGYEPWTSDGTIAGTRMVANLSVETTELGSNPDKLIAHQDRLYFSATDGIAGVELWRSDGSANGTELAADVVAGVLDSVPEQVFRAGSSLMFFARYSTSSDRALWRYEPGSRTLDKMADIGPAHNGPPGSVTASGVTYFAAFDGVWRTDGTIGGTQRLWQIAPALMNVTPSHFTELGGKAYFFGRQFGLENGFGLWVTDGTDAGTQRLSLHDASYTPTFLAKLGDRLYYVAADGTNPPALWRSDGTAGGTVVVTAFPELRRFIGVVNQRLLFVALPSGSPEQHWSLAANATAFTKITTPRVVESGTASENGALAFFTGTDATHGFAPWVTDGTEAGTRALIDVASGTSTGTTWLGDFHNVAIFTARSSPTSTLQFWRSDGTVAGTTSFAPVDTTRPIAPLTPIAATAGNHFYFALLDGVIGTELYAIENEAPVAAGDTASTDAGQSVTVNVLANDSDADGTIDSSGVTISSPPQHGTATVTGAGNLSYTPSAGYSGPDSFAYSVRDRQGRSSAPATVSVTVAAPPTPPPPGGGGSGGGGGSSGGGGGVLDWLTLLLLAAYVSVARNSRTRAAFVLDPDGTSIEAVYHRPAKRSADAVISSAQ